MTKYLIVTRSIKPEQLQDEIKTIAEENGIKNFNRYDFSHVWEDSQGYTVYNEFIEDYATKKRLNLTIKNSYQKDLKNQQQKNLTINND